MTSEAGWEKAVDGIVPTPNGEETLAAGYSASRIGLRYRTYSIICFGKLAYKFEPGYRTR